MAAGGVAITASVVQFVGGSPGSYIVVFDGAAIVYLNCGGVLDVECDEFTSACDDALLRRPSSVPLLREIPTNGGDYGGDISTSLPCEFTSFRADPVLGVVIIAVGPHRQSFWSEFIPLKFLSDQFPNGLAAFELDPESGISHCRFANNKYSELCRVPLSDLYEKGIPAIGDMSHPDDLEVGTVLCQLALLNKGRFESPYRTLVQTSGSNTYEWARYHFVAKRIDPVRRGAALLLCGGIEDFHDYGLLLGLQSTYQAMHDIMQAVSADSPRECFGTQLAAREATDILKLFFLPDAVCSLEYSVAHELETYRDLFRLVLMELEPPFPSLLAASGGTRQETLELFVKFIAHAEPSSIPEGAIVTAVKYVIRKLSATTRDDHSLIAALVERLLVHLPSGDLKSVLQIELALAALSGCGVWLGQDQVVKTASAAGFGSSMDGRFLALQCWLDALIVRKLDPSKSGELDTKIAQLRELFPESEVIHAIVSLAVHTNA